MKLWFCVITLNTLIQIRPKITISTGKLEEKLQIFSKISHFLEALHFRGGSDTGIYVTRQYF